MKKIRICTLFCCLAIILLAGCYGIPIEHNYIGMTKAEAAAHLEKHANRSRWSKNRFAIEISEKGVAAPYWFKNDEEVAKTPPVISANEWRCDFFPQRHWLLGWNALAASWRYKTLIFKDGKVVTQTKGKQPYKTYGTGGQSPFPQFPKNFHKINENIFRSGQPDEDEFESLCTFYGLRSVLNLRESNSDKKMINAVNKRHSAPAVTLYNVPLDTGKISETDLYKILTVIRDAPKPLLIHCRLGSNRTGCAVAAYRIVFENWSVEKAISELMKPEYGHHRYIYTNIPELLRKADWKKIKATFSNKKK